MSKVNSVPTKVEKVYGRTKGYITTTTTDSVGEQFTLNALLKMRNFYQQNPYSYLDHDRSQPPVGRLTSLRIVVLDDFFALEGETEVLDESAWKRMLSGELRGFSVGGAIKK